MSDVSGKLLNVLSKYKVLVGGLLLIVLLLLAVFVYAGMWPPVYVVESESMQHSDDRSFIGTIDTGDLVIVQSSDGSDVRTYVESYSDGHRTFGDYGDVIVYERYGRSDYTPIIHRAMLRLEFNATSSSFDAPSLAGLPSDKWGNGLSEEGRWWNLTGVVEIYDVGYRSALLSVDLTSLLAFYADHDLDHGGIITMGDHNVREVGGVYVGFYDQYPSAAICREPVMDGWIVGEAKAELPWLGLIKLWVNGNMPANTPDNSKNALLIVLVLVIAVPMAMDLAGLVLQRRGIDVWARIKERIRPKK
ncbi:MAG: S26 family signal peptidase [Methanomassiliicoccales archaeon]|nr:S26 family signal peptidase [Methanomassiliicoccales archaeon]